MKEKILEGLNPPQIEGVKSVEGPVMVIAGAGSGKTRVLTCRAAWLMSEHQVDPFNILALTFTNKAAREMKERIIKMVGDEGRNVWMGTFHSIFARILRMEAEHLGYEKNFTIYDTDDSKNLMKTIIKEFNLDTDVYKPSSVLYRISMAKNNLYSYEQYLENSTFRTQDEEDNKPMIGELYKIYQVRLKRFGAMDFDDLLFYMNVLLRDFPDVLMKYQRLFKYILVDEYQDTNFSQYVIVKKLAALYRNVCVVGDDAQSIYAFRGANIQNILNFQQDYPDVKIIKLEQNYRSTKVIVEASNCVIKHNEKQIHKKIWTSNDEGSQIKVMQAESDREEGVLIANDIFEQKMNHQMMNSDFAILYRTNAQSRALEEALRRRNIPYRILSGMSFYGRKEIKDVLAYFRVVINHNDEEALLRIINFPARGIGDTTLGKIKAAALALNMPFWKIAQNPLKYNVQLPEGIIKKIQSFLTMITNFSAALPTTNAFELATSIVQASGILFEFQKENTPEAISHKDNIEELLNGVQAFTEGEIDAPGSAVIETEPKRLRTLDTFMQDIALVSNVDEKNDNPNTVSMMTIHAAKGLEFPFVYIAGLEENLFPNTQMLTSRLDLEEERRLFYVAVTRAERQLTLSYAQMRFRWGNLTFCEPSRFLTEIDDELVLDIPKKMSMPSIESSSSKSESSVKEKKPIIPVQKPISLKLKKLSEISPAMSQSSAIYVDIQENMRVFHQKFGKGTVKNIEGKGDNKKAIVLFDDAGERTLLMRFAKLDVIEE
ncbi:MAG: UvrD-helicase domain-containing protein [Bacteroidales bacterium]|nr:UvrD-helicase domain-containing protein [Bacteroidales bacterium]